jgi:hypothetical protein
MSVVGEKVSNNDRPVAESPMGVNSNNSNNTANTVGAVRMAQ